MGVRGEEKPISAASSGPRHIHNSIQEIGLINTELKLFSHSKCITIREDSINCLCGFSESNKINRIVAPDHTESTTKNPSTTGRSNTACSTAVLHRPVWLRLRNPISLQLPIPSRETQHRRSHDTHQAKRRKKPPQPLPSPTRPALAAAGGGAARRHFKCARLPLRCVWLLLVGRLVAALN